MMLLFRLKAEATRLGLVWLRQRSVWLPASAGRPSRALELRLKAAITFSCVATSLAAQAPTPAALGKLSQARTISAADCTAARVGDAVPTSAVGEPAGAVTIAAPRWVAATETLPARCEVDGSIDPVDR